MQNVEIRPALLRDAEAIALICREDLGYPCEPAFVGERLRDLDTNREAVFSALMDGVVVGFVHVEKYETLYYEKAANLLGLAVKEKCRGSGIGRRLIEAAENWARDNGIRVMRLNSGAARGGAHEFYRRLGYGSEKTQLRFMKRL